MPTAVSIHHAKLSEAMRGDNNCHLHIGKTIKTSHATCTAASAMAADYGWPRQETVYTLCTYIILLVFMLIAIDSAYFLFTDTVSTFTVSLGRRKVTGKVNRTRTGFPYCVPGAHLGMALTTRNASSSR